jgi:hypothetical protein
MKTLVLALLAPVAIADCVLKAGVEKLAVTCSIPESTTISSECCNKLQGMIDKEGGSSPPEPPTPEEQQAIMMSCQSFQMYVMMHAPMGPPPQSQEEEAEMVINALPEGLSCTETITGGGKSACELHAEQGKLGVTCEIPEETTITPECCSVLQGGIDKSATSETPPSPEEQQKALNACSSVYMYSMQKANEIGAELDPMKRAEMLPSGLSCKEAISGDKMLSLYANRPILSTITMVAGFGSVEMSEKASAMSPVMFSIAGFFAGAVFMAGVFLRYSWKPRGNQEPLLSEPQMA